MVQYPFGASLFTSFISRIVSLPVMTSMGLIVAVMSGLIVSGVCLISRELLRKCKIREDLADVTSLVSAFMVFCMPVYFLNQYTNNFYYSMIFGELLVLLSLLALLKSEAGNDLWITVFMLMDIGIIYTYTLFIIIPLSAFLLLTILNHNKISVFSDKKIALTGMFVFFLFLIFSIQRLSTGISILTWEGGTVAFSIFNFNIIFIILIVSGYILFLKKNTENRRNALSIYLFVMVLEYFAFIFLNHFGIIALYFANKIFFMLILLVSCIAPLPIISIARRIKNLQFQKFAAGVIVSLIGLYSIYSLLTYPVASQPYVTNDDVIFSKNVETYLHNNNISSTNLSIISGTFKGHTFTSYFYALLIHINKEYAVDNFLLKPTTFNSWLNNPNSSYGIGELVNGSYPDKFSVDEVKLEIIIRDGKHVLLKKIT